MNKSIIKLKNVWKIYGKGSAKVEALREINLDIKKGEFVAIMGKSGSGKSTLLNSIGCLDIPTEGEIYLDSFNISHLSESDLAQIRGKKIGFIFQQFNLIQSLTALENVMMPMMFQNIPKSKREERARYLLNIVGLSHRLNHLPSELSGGEMQRVAIARSLANDPEVILADEPTGNLDSKTGQDVMKFLNELNDKGKTIIMVTHDEDLAKQHSEIIYTIKDGRI